jgi:hypothetical protein
MCNLFASEERDDDAVSIRANVPLPIEPINNEREEPDDLDDVVATLIGEFKNHQPTNVFTVYNVSICQPYEYLAQI